MQFFQPSLITPIADTLQRSAAQGEIVAATSPSFEQEVVALTGVRPQSKESKEEDTCKKGKMMEFKKIKIHTKLSTNFVLKYISLRSKPSLRLNCFFNHECNK